MSEFYVGYREQAPDGVARFVRGVVLALLVGAAALAALLALFQSPFEPGEFEFGRASRLGGVVVVEPYPELLVPRPGSTRLGQEASRYLLVSPGKHGAEDMVRNSVDRYAAVEGTLIHREGHTMVELSEPAVSSSGVPVFGQPEDLGLHTLVGEIVDTKCYFGTMKPGRSHPHRECAANCIRGGIPPALLVQTPGGGREVLLLVDAQGRAVHEAVLEHVGEPVEITGRVQRVGNRLVLAAAPSSYRRVQDTDS